LAFVAYASILFIEKVAFDSHSLTAHNHSDKKEDHDEITLVYDAELKEYMDNNINEPLYKQINNHQDHIYNNNAGGNKTKTFKEDNIINTTIIGKDENKITNHNHIHNEFNSHKHPHKPNQIHNKHSHNISKEEIVNKDLNEKHLPNIDNFVLNETENGDNLDYNIDEEKHTTRPRVNTFDHSKLQISQMRKHLNGALFQENKKKKKKRSKILDVNCAHDHSHHEESDSDIEEATLKNVVSSKGKFLSLLQARNICKIFSILLLIIIIKKKYNLSLENFYINKRYF